MREKSSTEEQRNVNISKIIDLVKKDNQGIKNSFSNANKVIGLYQLP